MQLLITASKDTYITDKIIDNTYRSKNSNAGHAATLDLFKLFEESGEMQGGTFLQTDVTEKSAVLVKFDYSKIAALTSSMLDINNKNSFKAYIELTDVSSGLQKPFGFSALCNPLAVDFEEGYGIDVNKFADLGSSNYLTASFLGGSPIIWKTEGAAAAGGVGLVKATGSITVASHVGLTNTATFTLSDGTNTVVFTANDAATTPTKTTATSYTFGINTPTDTPTIADRIFAAIALAKAEEDLNITATDPDVGSIVGLSQDAFGPTGNTDIVLGGTAIERLTITNLRGGYSMAHLDHFTSASFGTTKVDFGSSAYLANPNDDLIFDVTNAVSASIKGLINNYGFRIGFSGSYDSDAKTRFVKRFASRHVGNKLLIPKLKIFFNDELSDDTSRIFLDKAATVLLRSKKGLSSSNLFDNSNSQVINDNCGKVKITSGSYALSANFSQVNMSSVSNRLPGVYRATLTVPSNNSLIKKAIAADPTGFNATLSWLTSDETITFLTKKIRVRNTDHSVFDVTEVSVNFVNRKPEYSYKEDINVQVSAVISASDYHSSKISSSLDNFSGDIHYRILELVSKDEIISWDFGDSYSTVMSLYDGVYKAVIKAGTLPVGYSYILEVCGLVDDNPTIFDSFVFKVT